MPQQKRKTGFFSEEKVDPIFCSCLAEAFNMATGIMYNTQAIQQ
jgi:nitrite reductase/ring-hydroxylating ferredoxin subunit